MEDREKTPTQQLDEERPVPADDDSRQAPSKHAGLIFVCDPSADAERVMGTLRSRGYPVVDVPLGLLTSRLRYQVPDLVLCDADASEVLDHVRALREEASTADVRVVFFASEGSAADNDPSFRSQGNGLFFRPLDVDGVCAHVERLIGPPARSSQRDINRIAPRRAPVIVPSARKPYRSDEGPSSSRVPEIIPPPSELSLPPRTSLVPGLTLDDGQEVAPELSPETKALLDRAQAAAAASMLSQTSRPTRLGSTEAVQADLDFEVLAALEAPLDELLEAASDSEVPAATAGGFGVEDSSPPLLTSQHFNPPSAPATGHSYASEAAVTNPGGRIASLSAPAFLDIPLPTGRPSSPVTNHDPGLLPSLASLPTHTTATVSPPSRSQREDPPTGRQPILEQLPEELPARSSEEEVPEVPKVPEPPELDLSFSDLPEPPLAPLNTSSASDLPTNSVRNLAGPFEHLPVLRLADMARTPEELRPGGATRALATAIRERATGALAFQDSSGIRRIVLRDGDIVTAVSGAEDESLVRFLAVTGDLDTSSADRLARTLPPFGRHAGAALIAHGHLQQEDLWPVLRAHSEWILATVVGMNSGRVSWEEEIPVRLQDEPAVFGGAAGCEVFVEAVRRAIEPARAWELLGAGSRILGPGAHRGLLGECALEPEIEAVVPEAMDTSLEPFYRAHPDLIAVIYALLELDVLTDGGGPRPQLDRDLREPATGASPEDDDALDDAAFQARLLARRALVDEGDYFSLLGVKRTATEHELTRARDALHRQFSLARLSPRNAHLIEDLELVLQLVDEAYEVLRDPTRRERYRRALSAKP